jgi:hypothetical protein
MVFLDARIAHPMSVRSISQQAFVVGDGEEDLEGDATSEFGDSVSNAGAHSSYDGDGNNGDGAGKCRKGSGSRGSGSTSSFALFFLTPMRATAIIAVLSITVIFLVIALTVFVVLYMGTFRKCKTKFIVLLTKLHNFTISISHLIISTKLEFHAILYEL